MLAVSLAVAISTLAAVPSDAKIIKKGATTNGYYWQLIEKKDGKTAWLCRKTGVAKIQSHQLCSSAGAKGLWL